MKAINNTYNLRAFADHYAVINSVEQLKQIPQDRNPFLLGHGANLILCSEHFKKRLFVRLGESFSFIQREGACIEAGAAASLLNVCRYCIEFGLSGMENLAGIPGTIGGAIYMNAGAYGTDMSKIVESVKIFKNGHIQQLTGSEILTGYRKSAIQDEGGVVLSATIKLTEADPEQIKDKFRETFKKRYRSFPFEPNAGSVFKKPMEQTSAGQWIDSLGLKGHRVGDAEISTVHAGFIVNRGNAGFQDILDLKEDIKRRVYEHYKVNLEQEQIEVCDIGCPD